MIIRARLFCFVKGLRCGIFPDLRNFFYACFQRGILVAQVAVRLIHAFVPDQLLNQVCGHAQFKRAGDEPDAHPMPLAPPLDAATLHVSIKPLLRGVILKDGFALASLPPRPQRRHDACGYRQCVAPSTLIFCDLDFCTLQVDVIPPLPPQFAPTHASAVEQSIQHGSGVGVVPDTAVRMPRRTLGCGDESIDLVLRERVCAYASASTRSGYRHPRIDAESALHDEPTRELTANRHPIPNCLR